MPSSAVDVIGPAFEHTKQQLLKPFRFGQWTRLALVGLLSGEMGSGGCGVQLPPIPEDFRFPGQEFAFQGAPASLAMMLGIVALSVLGIIVFLLLLYLASMMQFVLFDSILSGECRIKEFWRRRRESGFRYFVWRLLFGLAVIAGLALLVGLPALLAAALGWFSAPRDHLLGLIGVGSVVVLVFLAALIALAVVAVLIKDFVVPQMACENVTVGEGWSRLWTMVKAEKGGYAAYVGMKIALAVAAGVILSIAGLVILLILLIPIGGLGLLAVFGGSSAGLTWTPLTIILAVLGLCIAVALLLFVVALISVPAVVFFPAYSIHFFAARYPALKSALNPSS